MVTVHRVYAKYGRGASGAGFEAEAIVGDITSDQLEAAVRAGLVVHHDGIGKPTTDPTAAGQISIDNEGKGYASGDRLVEHEGDPPSITSLGIGDRIGQRTWARWKGSHVYGTGSADSDGDFFWETTQQEFRQYRSGSTATHTWAEIVQYIADNSLGFPTGIDEDTIYIGNQHTQTQAGRAASEYPNFDLATNDYVFIGHNSSGAFVTLWIITGFTAGTVVYRDEFFWRDAPLTRDEVHAVVNGASITNLSDTPDTLGAHGELLGVNSAGNALVFSELPLSWAVQIDTELVPELNQDAISVPRLVLETSGLTHRLVFLDWTATNISRINHLPVGGHIGLRQGVTTRILRVETAWDEANSRYEVINVNTGILSESASGTDTELLLTAQSTRETVLFGRGEPPLASAELVGMRYLDLISKVEYGCFDDPHRTSQSTGDFDDINRSDITINLVDRLEDILVVENEWLYRIAANRFYAATDVGAGVFRWVDDTSDDALAGSLVTSTDEVVWLGRHIDNEEALRGLTAIETGKEYFFYREQDGNIVRLDNSSFTAAGSAVAHPFWFPIRADDREEHIFNARDGLPDLANDGSDDNRIGVVNDGVYIVDVDPINATDPTADSWADYTATGYEGAFAADPTIDTGEWYANYVRRTFREFQSTNFGLGWIPHAAPDDFIGWYQSRQDALDHAAERGVASGEDFVAFTGAGADPKVETATNFTPASSARIQRNWVFVPVSANDGTKADADLGNIALDVTHRVSARTELGLGTAATRDTGEAQNNVPILDADGKLADGVVPDSFAEDNYVDTLAATIAGNDVTIELGRTGTLSSLSRSFTVPGASGGGSSVGVPDIETLFDNFPSGQDSGTALPAITDNDAPNWTPNGHTNVPLGKALTSADDDKFLMVDWSAQYTFGSNNHQVRRARWVIPADLIRGSATNTETTGDAQVDGWIAAISRVDSDHDNSLDDNDARLLLLSRGRDGSDHDRLRIIYGGGDDNDVVDTTQIYVRAELVPQVAQSRSIIQVSALPALADASVERIYSVVSTVDGTLGNETLHYVRETNPHQVVLTAAEVDAGQHGYSAISSGALRAAGDIHPLPDGVQQLWSSSGSGVELIIDTSVTDGPFADETDSLRLAYREHGSGAGFTHVDLDTVTSGGGTRTFRSSTGAEGDIFSDLSIQYDLHFRLHGETESVRLYDDKHYDRILTRDLLNEELVEVHDALSEKADDDLSNISLTDAQKGTVRPALGLGGVTHIEGGATYNNNVITVSTTEVVRGGDGILFAVPSPFGTSATQAVSLAIDGQANSEHPLHDRNGDAIHEADLTVDSVYIAISDADSWDILVLPSGDVDLSTYAPLASPALTGTPTAPTPTDSSGDTQIATKKYVDDNSGGTGGPSETLFDNFAGGPDAATVLDNITTGNANWGANGHTNVDLGRVIAEADDDEVLVVDFQADYTFDAGSDPISQKRFAHFLIPADLFRLADVNAETSGSAMVDGWPVPLPRVDNHMGNDLHDNVAELLLVSRGRTTGGNDRLRIVYGGTDAGDLVDTTSISVRAVLIPKSGGGGITEAEGDARYAQQSENLADLDSTSTARTNLGLGTAATRDTGTGFNTLALLGVGGRFDDNRIALEVARLASPALTGTPTAPTPSTADDSTQVATTEFVQAEIAGLGGGDTVAAGFTELRAPATLSVATTWTATGATIPDADGDEWVRMNGNFDGEVPENFEFLSSRLRVLAEHIVGGSTSTGDVERLQFHDGSVYQRVLMARTAANEIILRHESDAQSLGNLSIYSYSAITGTGLLTLDPLTEAAHNFNFNPGQSLQSGQNRDLFDTNVTLPTDLADDEAFILRLESTNGEAQVHLTKNHLEELAVAAPVTWSTSATGVNVATGSANKNAYYYPLGQNRGLFIGRSNETPYRLLWGWSNVETISFTLQIVRVRTGAGGVPGTEHSDSSLDLAGVNILDETDIDVPTGTWAWVNPGLITATPDNIRAGAWERFLVEDLTGLDDAADGDAATSVNSLSFGIPQSEHQYRIGKTSGGKITVAVSSTAFTPSEIRVRD